MRSSAPPLESGSTSWKTPLPKVRVPTTVARLPSLSAPVTISEAEALPPSTSTTTGMSAAMASPSAWNWRSARVRPWWR